jgi:phenylpropionate dioxygenase-like ring-hydroxylating dioxygenase large terminal subunit
MSTITGVPWLLAHKSMLVVNQPQKISLYDRDYVIWKDRLGKVSVLPNTCPHLGGMLSEGWCAEHSDQSSSIACPYHGLEFDSHGCTVLPGTQKKTLPQLKPPKLIIQGDFIWSYGEHEPQILIPPVLNEVAASYDFIGYSADTSVEIDLRTMLLNMHDYNHQTGAHHEPMKIKAVELEQFVDEGHKSHALFHSVLTSKTWKEKVKNPTLLLLPEFVTTHLENFFPHLVILHADNQFGKVAQCHIFVPETDTDTRIYVLLFAQPKIPLLKNFVKKFVLDLAKTVIDQDVDVLQKVYPHSPQKIRLNNEVGMNWVDRNFDNFPDVVPPNYSMRSQPKFEHEVATKFPFVESRQLIESNYLAETVQESEKSLI